MEKISIVVPCYNEEKALPLFVPELLRVADGMSGAYGLCFEIIFVDDGSADHTLELLRSYAGADPRIHYLSFSRNFGKEAALYAGFQYSTGDYAAAIDADMQDPPALLPEMYETLRKGGYSSVAVRRADRKGEPPVRSFLARCFYRVINKISDAEFVEGARDFRLMDRRMVNAILSMGEYNRFIKGIYSWVGFRTKWLQFENVQRVAGETKWSIWQLFRYSFQGIMAFSTVPLAIPLFLGLLLCLLGPVPALYALISAYRAGNPVSGWMLLASLVLFLSGIQLVCMGILGQYLAKAYLEAKRRPVYILRETDLER